MQNTLACDCFIGLAFKNDLFDVMSDVTCSWGPRQATENRSLQRHQINISNGPVTELLLVLDQWALHWIFLYLYLALDVASTHDPVSE